MKVGYRIAVIEDNVDNRLLLRFMLHEFCTLDEYEDGIAGLEGLKQKRPDLVLLDISLPDIDGEEVLSRIRADETLKTLPVIALTAHAAAEDRERFLRNGFDAFVAKPLVDESILLKAMDHLLREKALQGA